jgi:hypothetical protein
MQFWRGIRAGSSSALLIGALASKLQQIFIFSCTFVMHGTFHVCRQQVTISDSSELASVACSTAERITVLCDSQRALISPELTPYCKPTGRLVFVGLQRLPATARHAQAAQHYGSTVLLGVHASLSTTALSPHHISAVHCSTFGLHFADLQMLLNERRNSAVPEWHSCKVLRLLLLLLLLLLVLLVVLQHGF